MSQLRLLRIEHGRMKIIHQIFGIDCMMNNRCMTTYSDLFIAKPRNAFTYIIDVFAGDRHNYIIRLCELLFLGNFLSYVADRFIDKKIVVNINLPIMDAWYALRNIILFLKASPSLNRGNSTQFLILHSIRAQFPDQFLQAAHASTSISAMILSISSRNSCSRATISAISAFSFTMSIFSRVSSAST